MTDWTARTDALLEYRPEDTDMTIDDIEHQIKSTDVVLSILRDEFYVEQSLEAKLDVMKHQRKLERIRSRLREEWFAAMDAEDAARAKR